jgi:formylglycine-generating enzyme required for sulfatase activity
MEVNTPAMGNYSVNNKNRTKNKVNWQNNHMNFSESIVVKRCLGHFQINILSILNRPTLAFFLMFGLFTKLDCFGATVHQTWKRVLANGHTYEVLWSDPITWHRANAFALRKRVSNVSGHLATLSTEEENSQVTKFLNEVFPYQVWIGGFQANKSSEPYGGWQWINDDGQIPRTRFEGFRNWAPGEPNNVGGHEDYLTINRFGNGQWNDEGVYGVQGFIIEYDDESSGIDDGGDDTGGDDTGGDDTGGDDTTDGEEVSEGTDPNNPLSVTIGPGYLTATKKLTGIQLTIQTRSGESYQLQRSNELLEWENDGGIILASGESVKIMRERLQTSRYWRVLVMHSVEETTNPTEDPFTIMGRPKLNMEMMPIPAGTFVMGSPSDEQDRDSNEGPQTTVTITKPFWLGKTEVTMNQWSNLMGGSEWTFPAFPYGDDLPMERVSWNAAVAFCERLNERMRDTLPAGYHYTLPTEAQWEYACRAGKTTRFYYGDDPDYDQLGQYAWYSANSSNKTHPVGEKLPNEWGLYDMYGNVSELCLDWNDYYLGGSFSDPQGPLIYKKRVLRGGGWGSDARFCRSAARFGNEPHLFLPFGKNGFRVALSPVAEVEARSTEDPFMILGLNMEMMPIPAGTFVMGSPSDEQDRHRSPDGHSNEGPQTTVTITKPFWLGKTEVTQAQWEAVMGQSGWGSVFNGDDLPVERVNWNSAVTFCGKLNELKRDTLPAGYHYTLPTEAQWEYACRAGTTTRFYYGDDPDYDQLGQYAWFGGKPHPVGEKLPNEWGLYDMYGNVSEWCLDWYDNYPGGSFADPQGPMGYWGKWGYDYPGGSFSDPQGPLIGAARVVRGGDSRILAGRCRSATRGFGYFGLNGLPVFDHYGFRVALSPVAEVEARSTEDPFMIVGLNMEMMPIPAGTFLMGSPSDEQDRDSDEGPQTTVAITKPFWLGKTEVTQAQWETVMGNNPSSYKVATRPVTHVSYDDAVAFCEKLYEIKRGTLPDGYHYTLPTEAQWEYACRAGTTTRFYYGDDPDYDQLGQYAWYSANSSNKTHPVGEKLPNEWGFYDMYGNVSEFCLDWFGDYTGGSVSDPQGPQSSQWEAVLGRDFRVNRGGSWSRDAGNWRSAARSLSFNDIPNIDTGFRVALSPVPSE